MNICKLGDALDSMKGTVLSALPGELCKSVWVAPMLTPPECPPAPQWGASDEWDSYLALLRVGRPLDEVIPAPLRRCPWNAWEQGGRGGYVDALKAEAKKRNGTLLFLDPNIGIKTSEQNSRDHIHREEVIAVAALCGSVAVYQHFGRRDLAEVVGYVCEQTPHCFGYDGGTASIVFVSATAEALNQVRGSLAGARTLRPHRFVTKSDA